MNDELSEIFANCLEAIEQGRLSVDECLDTYPRYRAELIDLFYVTMQMRAVPTVYPTAEFRQGAQAQLLAKLPPRMTVIDERASAQAFMGTTAVGLTLTQRVRQWWQVTRQQRPTTLATGLVVLLVGVFLIGIWLRGSGPSIPETLDVAEDVPAIVDTTTNENEGEFPISTPDNIVIEGSEEGVSAADDMPFAAFVPLASRPLVLNAQTAALEVAQGIAEVQGADGQWRGVNGITAVLSGQRVRTNALSSATLTFHDGSRATLGPNTEISLDEVDAQKAEDGFRTIVMTQWLGESEHDVDFRGDSGSRYEVLTPNGSGRARGTTFQVVVGPNLESQYIVTQGRVDVTNVNVTVIIIGGQMSLIPPQQPPSPPRFIVTGEGEVSARGASWVIGGQTFTTIDSTVIVGNPQIGDIVSVVGYLLPDGTLVATHIRLRHQPPARQFTITGLVGSIGAGEWVVGGRVIAVNEETSIDETLVVGDSARATGVVLNDGTLLATQIERLDDAYPFAFTGIVEGIGDDSWTISGILVAVDENTAIEGDIVVGDVVNARGQILTAGRWLAEMITLVEATDTFFELTGEVQRMYPWRVAGVSFDIDAFTMIDGGIMVGDLVYVAGRILEDGSWLATEIRLRESDPLTFDFVGVVGSINPWTIGGVAVDVDDNTLIEDDVTVGDLVRVRGVILPDGTLLAISIELIEDDDPIGCFVFTTIIIGVRGNQVTLQGLPSVTLDDEIEIEGTIATNAIITIALCVGSDGSITIVNIIIIHVPPPPPPPPPPPSNGGGGSDDDDD